MGHEEHDLLLGVRRVAGAHLEELPPVEAGGVQALVVHHGGLDGLEDDPYHGLDLTHTGQEFPGTVPCS